MATQVQRRRGTASEHNTFTGAAGEVTVNTTNDSLHVHDGATAGGIEAARADLQNADPGLFFESKSFIRRDTSLSLAGTFVTVMQRTMTVPSGFVGHCIVSSFLGPGEENGGQQELRLEVDGPVFDSEQLKSMNGYFTNYCPPIQLTVTFDNLPAGNYDINARARESAGSVIMLQEDAEAYLSFVLFISKA